MKKIIIYVLLGLLAISCKTLKDEDYFFKEINYINEDYEIIELKGDSISVDGYTTLFFSVHDSLILFMNNRLPGSMFFSISNVKTGKHYGNYVSRGRGPHESPIAPVYQFYKKGNDLMTLLTAPNESEFREWNISQTLEKGHTVYDTIIPYTWNRRYTSAAYLNIFRMDKDNILVKVPMRRSQDNKTQAWPGYQTISLQENKAVREYEVFKNDLYIGDPDKLSNSPFFSHDCVKPDGKKLMQCMASLSQINILDFETGAVSYHRTSGSLDVSAFKEGMSFSKIPLFYHGSQCDDKYIYALYSGLFREDKDGKPVLPGKIHQYDWNGRLIREIILSEPTTQIWLDTVNNLLYTYHQFNEHILRYDLNELDG